MQSSEENTFSLKLINWINIVANTNKALGLNPATKNPSLKKENMPNVIIGSCNKATSSAMANLYSNLIAMYKDMAEFLSTRKFTVENLIKYYNIIISNNNK